MLSRKKQLAINLLITAFFVTSSAGVSYANSGGTGDVPALSDYTGSYVVSGTDDANDANVTIDSDVVGNVYGGYNAGTGNAINNKVTVTAGEKIIHTKLYGGYAASGNADGNSVTISGGAINKDVYGGYSAASGTGNANGNSVNISGGHLGINVYGGYSVFGNVSGNSVTISGGAINNIIHGGYSEFGNASGNSVTISGGEIMTVVGGWSKEADAINNTVIIKGNPNLYDAQSEIHGGVSQKSGADFLTGNKLEVYRHTTNLAGTHAVKVVESFEKMNFYLGNTTKNGDIMLQVKDQVKLDKTDVGVDIASGEKLNLVAGDKVTLINSDTGVTAPKSKTIYSGLKTIYGGIEKIYGLEFFKEDKALGVTVYTVQNNNKVEAIPVAQMTGQSMLRMGGDTIAMQGMTSALVATRMEQVENSNEGEGAMPSVSTEKSFLNKGAVFATIGGGTSKYKTSGTSDVNSYNVMTGMAWRINQPKNNNLILGAFFEGGWGNYTTNNSFADGNVRGDGSSDYMGGGILGRYEFASGTYLEGSVRMGQVKNDYHSDNLRGAGDGRVGYNTSDTYTGAHLGLGYIKKINDQTELDLYGKYLYTHQDGSSVTIVGDNVSFDPANSHRLRLGARLAQKTTKDFNGYVGLAYEYEFDGKMGSSINHNPILAPSVKGSSGILELGVIFKPTNNKNLSLDLSVNGYAGKREGVSGNLQLKYLF